METDFQNISGKGLGEVMRDASDFLALPFTVTYRGQTVDLTRPTPDLCMGEQFLFALLSEAEVQKISRETAVPLCRRVSTPLVPAEVQEAIFAAFADKTQPAYEILRKKYGCHFTVPDGSYWSTVLALCIETGNVKEVLQYLRSFTVTLMEFAYLDGASPDVTYTWTYYDSFRKILDDVLSEPETEPQALSVASLGGSSGETDGGEYSVSVGIDVKNPNPDRMAREIVIDVLLKDRDGNVIARIGDRLQSLDPLSLYHYGVTKKVRGTAVAGIAASARAGSWLKLKTPIMRHASLSDVHLYRRGDGMRLTGTVVSGYDKPIGTPVLHYQFRNAEGKILGGGSEWLLSGLDAGGSVPVTSDINVALPKAAKVTYSLDFDALELVKD